MNDVKFIQHIFPVTANLKMLLWQLNFLDLLNLPFWTFDISKLACGVSERLC